MKTFAAMALILGVVLTVSGCGSATTIPEAPPTVTGVSPELGPLTGGQALTVKGTGLTPDTIVRLGDKDVTNLVWVDSETMTCETPPADGGTNAGIQITNGNGTALLLGVYFYIPPPVVFSLSPNTGTPPGGIQTTITGKGFVEYDAGTNVVTIGGIPATNVVAVNDKTIRCIVPSGNGPSTVTVTNNNGSASLEAGFRYYPEPTVTAITPNVGTALGGTAVVVKGTGFVENSPGAASITIGGASATNIVVVNDTTITCNTPVGTPGPADITITNLNGSGTFTGGFTYHPYPTVTSVNPPTASYEGNVPVTVTGTGFVLNDAGAAIVRFDGSLATNVVVVNDTTITCNTPPTSVGAIPVSVTNDNGTGTLTGGLTVLLDGLFGTVDTQFYKINPLTGATTAIGAGIGHSPGGMAIGTDGVIYAVTARDLIKINPVTGVGTVIAGLSPVPAGPINDLSFQGGRLMGTYASGWQAVSFTTNGFEINTTTGAVTSLWTGPQGPGDQRRGLEYLNGVMYWGNISDYSRAIQTPLYDLNMDTGAKSSAVTARGVHAAYSMGIYDGEVYVVALSTTFSNASLDNLTLVRMDSSMSTGTYIGDLPSGFSTIAGTP